MNTELQKSVADAIAPLLKEISALRLQVEQLTSMFKPPETVQSAQAIVASIPKDIFESLEVVSILFDPNQIWFRLLLKDGSGISVKKNEFDFRVRHRDPEGKLLAEAAPSVNGLANALKKLKP